MSGMWTTLNFTSTQYSQSRNVSLLHVHSQARNVSHRLSPKSRAAIPPATTIGPSGAGAPV